MTESITPEPIQEPVSVDDNAASLTVDVGTALPAGTANIGDVDVASIAAGDNNIGNVDIVTLPALVAGTANIGDVDIASPLGAGTEAAAVRVTVATDSTGVLSVDDNAGSLTVDGTVTANQGTAGTAWEVVGDVAHDAAATTVNPVSVGATHETLATTAPTNRLASVTDGDLSRLSTTDGALYVIPTGPQYWDYHENSSSALTDTTVEAAPGAGLSLYVTNIVVSTGAATAFNIFFEEGVTTVLGPYYLEAVAGRGFSIQFQTPKKITANTALTVTTSAAIAHAIDVTGFVAPG